MLCEKNDYDHYVYLKDVLILVLVEDALWDFNDLFEAYYEEIVLILVLVEDALWENYDNNIR